MYIKLLLTSYFLLSSLDSLLASYLMSGNDLCQAAHLTITMDQKYLGWLPVKESFSPVRRQGCFIHQFVISERQEVKENINV